MIVLASLLAFVCVAIAVIIVLFVYFLISRRSNKARKIPLNVQFIISLFVIVFATRILMLLSVAEFTSADSFWDSVSKAFEEFYSLLGGLTFEGQYTELKAIALKILYFGSIAFLAICNTLLIVYGVSYPFQSKMALFFVRASRIFGKRYDIYIFTYATDDSFRLAKNIEYEYKLNKKRNKPIIIFSSYEIAPFDKDNEIHFKISQSNYFFIPTPKTDFKQRKSLIGWLFPYSTRKDKILDFITKNNISIFSLATNKENMGYESKNSDMVFDDIQSILFSISTAESMNFNALCERVKKDCRYISYYVLSNRDINFEFYENMLVSKFKEDICKGDEDLLLRELPPLFNVVVLNEAIMSAEDMIDKRHELISEQLDKNYFNEKDGVKCINYQSEGHNALVVGFGFNGQSALGHLYADCIGGYLDDKHMFIPNRFNATVIDNNIDKKIISFMTSHPAFVVADYEDTKISETEKYQKLRKMYKSYSDQQFEYIKLHMGFPVVLYKKLNFNNPKFMSFIDEICLRKYDSIIIALGNDETSIECANAILLSLRQYPSQSEKPICLFVNIRDAHNKDRLMWKQQYDEKIRKNVFVKSYGDAEDLYKITNFGIDEAAKIDKTYRDITGESLNYSTLEQDKYEFLKNCGLFERKTNLAAVKYGGIYEQYLKEANGFDKIKRSYETFKESRNKASTMKNPTSEDIKKGKDKSPLYFNDVEHNQYIENLKILGGFDGNRPQATVANFERIKSINDTNYLVKGKSGFFWRYLIQFDHNRWARHLMTYGRSFIKEFKDKVYPDTKKSSDQQKYWKNYIRLHDCLLPYSAFTNYHAKPNAEYLPYSEEDYDYGVILAAIGIYDKK